MKIRTLLFLFCALLLSGADAQRFYVKLSGKVTAHFTGDPVKGVLVRMAFSDRSQGELLQLGCSGCGRIAVLLGTSRDLLQTVVHVVGPTREGGS